MYAIRIGEKKRRIALLEAVVDLEIVQGTKRIVFYYAVSHLLQNYKNIKTYKLFPLQCVQSLVQSCIINTCW